MSLLFITSLAPRAGKTALSVGIGQRLSADGRKVRLLRLRSDSGDGADAEADARLFASLARERSPAAAAGLEEAEKLAREASGKDTVLAVEGPAGAEGEEARQRLAARALLVVYGDPAASVEALTAAARSMGESLVGVVATAVADSRHDAAARWLIEQGLPCLGVLPEDRTLASPRLDEIARALDGEYLVEPEDPDEVIDHFMIGSIASDPGQSYFARREHKAVITRFDKTELQLAALNTPLACLILTRGQHPSPYLLDRVRTEEAAVLLTAQDTVGSMHTLEELFGATRFWGRRKVERIGELVAEHLELPPLLSKLD